MKRGMVGLATAVIIVASAVMAGPVKAMPQGIVRGSTITCRTQQVHVGGPPGNLDHVTGYLRVDNWDTSSGHDWLGYVRVWSAIQVKFWRGHGHLNADSYAHYRFSVWIRVPFPTATVHWRQHCSL